MEKLARLVPVDDLALKNPGGLWSQLKADSTKLAPWKVIRNSGLWTDETAYKDTVWSWLCGKDKPIQVAAPKFSKTKGGHVHTISMDLGERKAEIVVGELPELVNHRPKVQALYVEMDPSMTELSRTLLVAPPHFRPPSSGDSI